jgi:hypothetical protein
MRAIPRMKLIWATVPFGTQPGSVIPFPNVSELLDAPIVGIEAYDAAFLVATPDLQPNVTAADMPTISVVLKDSSNERVQDIPATTLAPFQIGGIWKQFEPFVVNWQSSFVRVVGAPAAGTAFSVAFGVFYLPAGTNR